jgi:hypothetical protein
LSVRLFGDPIDEWQLSRLRGMVLQHRAMADRFQRERDEAVALLKWTRDLDHVSVQDSKDWRAKVDALLARIDAKEPR